MNAADSDAISDFFLYNRFSSCERPNDADIIVVNTCTVRQHAEDRAMSFIGTLKPIKKKNKNLKIFIAGCAASRLKNKLKEQFSFIDDVIPAYEIEHFRPLPECLSLHDTRASMNSTSKFITISRGCSNYCSYCVVPYVRGEEICRTYSEIDKEISCAIRNNIKEITLLGQNVNSYKDTKAGMDFADLLSTICKIPKINKISFLTSHPKDLSDKIISTMAKNNKISRAMHLPVQSGSNRILKLMNRKYTRSEYLNLANKMKKGILGLTMTTDIIVGFPTETERDFRDTLELVKEVGYNSAFTFKYSPREGTKSFLMEDDVPLAIKKTRLAELNKLIKSIQK